MAADRLAARFRAKADSLTKKIEDLRRPRANNTPRRARQEQQRHIEAAHLERCREAYLKIAEAHEAGTFPPGCRFEFIGFEEVKAILARRLEHQGYCRVYESNDWHDNTPTATEFRAWLDGTATADDREAAQRREAADRIARLEAEVRFLDIPGFFPTPPGLVAKLLDRAELTRGCHLLEPSAGKGDIADRARDERLAEVWTVERAPALRRILAAKGHRDYGCDFLAIPKPDHGRSDAVGFDRVVMNPPFENGQDMEHVRHAYDFLRPGGRLVAIMSAGTMFRSDRLTLAFRDWLAEVGAEVEQLPEGAFGEAFRSTKARTILVVIDHEETPSARLGRSFVSAEEGGTGPCKGREPASPPPPGCLF